MDDRDEALRRMMERVGMLSSGLQPLRGADMYSHLAQQAADPGGLLRAPP